MEQKGSIILNYAELSIKSNFSFLKGGSHPEEYAQRAINLGLKSFAITDENIFERPVNRLYYKHQKKGLGVTANLVESNQHNHAQCKL